MQDYIKNGVYDLEAMQKIVSQPDWYMVLQEDLRKYFWEWQGGNEAERARREALLGVMAEFFEQGVLAFADRGEDMDTERLPVDTIVVHHTSRNPYEAPLAKLDTLLMLRIDAKYAADPNEPSFGNPLWSGHFYGGHMTFIPYHYLVLPDGEILHILPDSAIGRHAGNWDVNCRSVALCLYDELEDRVPSSASLAAARSIIRKYPQTARLLPHAAVNPHTDCPGKLYASWKDLLRA